MEKIQHDSAKLEKAIKKLTILKGFYNHLVVYLIINLLGLLFFLMYGVSNMDKLAELDPNIREWINWNILLTPLFWGIGLFFHWLYAFQKKPGSLRDWEERQIKKYMEK